MIVIAGPNGSGKTSVTKKLLHHEWTEGTLYINPDEIAQEKFGDWNSQEAVLKAAKYSEQLRENCLREKTSFVFETVMSSPEKVDFIINHGVLVYQKNIEGGGHDVPISKIISRYYKSIANCKIISSLVDRLYVYDNSVDGVDASLQFRMNKGVVIKTYVAEVCPWAQDLLPSDK